MFNFHGFRSRPLAIGGRKKSKPRHLWGKHGHKCAVREKLQPKKLVELISFFQCSQKSEKSQTSIFFKLRHTTINWSDEITFKSSSLTIALSPSLPSLALSLALSPFLNLEQRKYQFQVKCAIDLPVQNVELFFVPSKKRLNLFCLVWNSNQEQMLET